LKQRWLVSYRFGVDAELVGYNAAAKLEG